MGHHGLEKSKHEQLEKPTSSVGTDMRALRKSRSITLTELAYILGRSVGFVSQIEHGLSEPSINRWSQSLISDYNFYAILFQEGILILLVTNRGLTPILPKVTTSA